MGLARQAHCLGMGLLEVERRAVLRAAYPLQPEDHLSPRHLLAVRLETPMEISEHPPSRRINLSPRGQCWKVVLQGKGSQRTSPQAARPLQWREALQTSTPWVAQRLEVMQISRRLEIRVDPRSLTAGLSPPGHPQRMGLEPMTRMAALLVAHSSLQWPGRLQTESLRTPQREEQKMVKACLEIRADPRVRSVGISPLSRAMEVVPRLV